MFRIVAAKPLGRYRVWLKYEDGTAGEVDLSHLAGHGVFKKWLEPNGFEQLSVGSSGDLCWGEDLDLCPDALYMKLTGKTVEELFPEFGKAKSHA
jgi:hypothetical protein